MQASSCTAHVFLAQIGYVFWGHVYWDDSDPIVGCMQMKWQQCKPFIDRYPGSEVGSPGRCSAACQADERKLQVALLPTGSAPRKLH